MKAQRTDRSDSRPMTPEEKLRFSEDVIHRGGEHAAGEAAGDRALEGGRVTKSGRLKIADVEGSEKKRR